MRCTPQLTRSHLRAGAKTWSSMTIAHALAGHQNTKTWSSMTIAHALAGHQNTKTWSSMTIAHALAGQKKIDNIRFSIDSFNLYCPALYSPRSRPSAEPRIGSRACERGNRFSRCIRTDIAGRAGLYSTLKTWAGQRPLLDP